MSKQMAAVRRSAIEIVAEVLLVCLNDGATKSAIMYRCTLNCLQLQRYLTTLCDQELLVKRENHFVVTDKGKEFLKQLANVT
jgi:predicted transcriptional regulator